MRICDWVKKIGFCILTMAMSQAFANHSPGLHLQLQNQTIDINNNDVEVAQIFQVDLVHSGVMLALKARMADKLAVATEPLVGQQVVWIWNGRVVYIQKLEKPLSADINILNLTSQEAEEVVKLGPKRLY
jgi:hypothetical protein